MIKISFRLISFLLIFYSIANCQKDTSNSVFNNSNVSTNIIFSSNRYERTYNNTLEKGIDIPTKYFLSISNKNIIFKRDQGNIGNSETHIYNLDSNVVLNLYNFLGDKSCFYDSINKDPYENHRKFLTVDTLIGEETKTILGNNCNRISLVYRNDSIVYWITEDIKLNLFIPDSPFGLGKVALQYECWSRINGSVTIIKANELKILAKEKNHSFIPPEDYPLIIPIFAPKNHATYTKRQNTFNFIKEIQYLGGDEIFYKELYRAIQVEPEYTGGYVHMEILKDGSISNIEVIDLNNSTEIKNKLTIFLEENKKWRPSIVLGKPINSIISFYY